MSRPRTSSSSAWRIQAKSRRPATHLQLKMLRLLFNSAGYILPRPMGRLAFSLWFRTYRYQAPAREARLLADATDHSFLSGDKRVACWSWGQGPRVLLVHGWNGRGAQLGSFVQPLVKAGYRVMTLDLPGHGKTAGKQTNLFEISKALCALNDLHGPFAAIIGHSFGVPCAVHAIGNGLQTDKLVSLSAPSGFTSLLKHFTHYLRLPAHLQHDIERRLLTFVGTPTWKKFADHYAPVNVRLSLLVHDQDDHVVPLAEARQLLPYWQNTRFIVTSGLGHRRILKNRQVIEQTVSFIREEPGQENRPNPTCEMAHKMSGFG